jgi:predicted nuclease of predicted toxin-antitoxin system
VRSSANSVQNRLIARRLCHRCDTDRTRKTSFDVDFAKVDAARKILGTKTLTETVDAALDEVMKSQHRAVSLPDLLVAACAEANDLVVLHYDADFDRIAKVTGQPTQWVVPRGAVA